MTEAAKKAAEQTEKRLEKVAETARERFDKVAKGRFRDKITDGRFADQVDHGVDQGRDESRRRQG